MKNKKTTSISKASIVFYVVAVLFVFAAAFFAKLTYDTIVTYSSTQDLAIKDIINVYISNCAPYLGFAFILYGIGVILNKFALMTDTLSACMMDAVEETQEEDDSSLEEFLGDQKPDAKDSVTTSQEETK